MRKILVFVAVLFLSVGTYAKADANKAMPAIVNYLLSGDGSNEKLLKTGQTKSYDISGGEITDGSIKDDGFYKKGVERSYTRVNDIVKDNVTGLEWQDNADVASNARNWADAKTYCQSLNFHNDPSKPWRLPTIDELNTIVNYEKGEDKPTGNKGAIDSVFQNVGQNSYSAYWSSTTSLYDTSNAWIVSFRRGHDSRIDKNRTIYVRCTR